MKVKVNVEKIAQQAKQASYDLANLSPDAKNNFLNTLASMLVENTKRLIEENKKDLAEGEKSGLSKAMLDRLALDEKRIVSIADGVRQVASLPDPVGEMMEETSRPNGLKIQKIRTPIGVIGIIFESRPNVTVDCAVLCLKSGNASVLRGGKEAFHSNMALAKIIKQALEKSGLPKNAVQILETVDREPLNELLKMDKYIDCIIPRGGEGLIRFVVENSTIPVIKHYKGVCHVLVDKTADEKKAIDIVVNGKTQRPSTCNATENLLIHKDSIKLLLPIAKALKNHKVEMRCDEMCFKILQENGIDSKIADPQDFYEEYNDLIIAIHCVNSISEAISFVNKHGSGHSDAIVTEDSIRAEKFLAEVDSASVYWNASTRFTDGFEFGFGAEIGISTDKLHARGPMGLRELCSYKYKIRGNGQIRS